MTMYHEPILGKPGLIEKPICVVCSGPLQPKTKTVFNHFMGPPIIGPGSREQYDTVQDGWTCQKCGLHYDFPPRK
jgi:hypothetical protein